ncbi:hypothetical protein ACMD2_27059, partial [Ananas comosus]
MCSEVIVRIFSITLKLTHLSSRKIFYLTNVYGPPTWDGKEDFCSELRALKGICTGKWVICGDFNFTRYQSERKGKHWSYKATAMFSDLIRDLAAIDLPLANQSFTWSNMQQSPTLAKLDRFLVSTEWDLSFPHRRVKALPRLTSDHTPILLSTSSLPPPRRFRFEKVWLTKGDFMANVPLWWNEVSPKNSAVLTLTAKLRHCRARIREWCSASFYCISNTIKTLQEDIQSLDHLEEHSPLPSDARVKRENLKSLLQSILQEEEILWKTRAQQCWLKEGDGNTKFFHAMANGRRRINTIESIEDDQGRLIYNEAEKRSYFFHAFKGLFGLEEDRTEWCFDLSLSIVVYLVRRVKKYEVNATQDD